MSDTPSPPAKKLHREAQKRSWDPVSATASQIGAASQTTTASGEAEKPLLL